MNNSPVQNMLHFPRFTSSDLDTLSGIYGMHASLEAMDIFEVMGPDGYTRKVIVKDKEGYSCYCPEGKRLTIGKSQLSEVI